MASRAAILVILMFFLISCHYKVQGIRTLSKEEDLELEKELRRLNKPAVKSIKTEHGDIYDCVDFYKQPAFDHPLLKNHTYHFQMRPTSRPNLRRDKTTSTNAKSVKIGLKKGCPLGTVPIRRTTKEDLLRAKLYSKEYDPYYQPMTPWKPGIHHAVVKTKTDPSKKYHGGGTWCSIYNPPVSGPQFSSAQMKIQSGPDRIQVGWTVNPSFYPDNKTRLFTYLQTETASCYNTKCPGFVIVNTEIPLESVVTPVSSIGGPIYDLNLFIFQDQKNGQWWLEVGVDSTEIGFWPPQIFTSLAGSAEYVDWGGEAYSPPSERPAVMGTGMEPRADIDTNAYCEQLSVINENHDYVNADNTEPFTDDASLYFVMDKGILRSEFRHLMFFGGPVKP